MARTIPSNEPTSVRAGDTWDWKVTVADFPADTWTLTYTLFNADGVISIVASADGTAHSVSVAPATTATYSAGRYDWIAQVSDGTDTYTVGKSAIQVLPDVSAAASYDGRSTARTIFDAINSTLEGRATAGDLDLVRSATGARDIQRDGLLKWRNHFAELVRREDESMALANGEQSGRFIQTRFVG